MTTTQLSPSRTTDIHTDVRLGGLEIVVRESTGPLDSPLGTVLRKLEGKIVDGKKMGLMARWEFGRRLVGGRGDNKQLSNGLLDAIVAELKIGRSEIKYRMQFATVYPTESEVATAVATSPSWRQIRATFPKPRPRPKTSLTPLPELTFALRQLNANLVARRPYLNDREMVELRQLAAFVAEIEAASAAIAALGNVEAK